MNKKIYNRPIDFDDRRRLAIAAHSGPILLLTVLVNGLVPCSLAVWPAVARHIMSATVPREHSKYTILLMNTAAAIPNGEKVTHGPCHDNPWNSCPVVNALDVVLGFRARHHFPPTSARLHRAHATARNGRPRDLMDRTTARQRLERVDAHAAAHVQHDRPTVLLGEHLSPMSRAIDRFTDPRWFWIGYRNGLWCTLPPLPRALEIAFVSRLDRRPALGTHHAARHRHDLGSEYEQVRTKTAVHDWRVNRGHGVLDTVGLDERGGGILCERSSASQSTCRALVVDTLPIDRQQLGSAWASRMAGIGHLMNYGIGSLDLESMFGKFMGDTQFKKLCLIAAIAMGVAQGTTCWAVHERILVRDRKTFHLPERIQAICMVQFWSWIGWFPFLFYGSTWVGEIYVRHEAPKGSADALTEVGRAGSVAFIVFALISFGTSIIMPWFVRNPEDEEAKKSAYTPRPPQNLESTLRSLAISKPSLLTVWALSNLFFAAAMIWAPLVKSTGFATLLIAMCGVPQAIAGWAPGTFLGIEVNRMSTTIPTSHARKNSTSTDSGPGTPVELSSRPSSPRAALHLRHSSTSSVITTSSTGELSGIYLGILNIYTTIPQFIGTAISWVVFSILEPGKSPELTQDESLPPSTVAKDGLSGIAVCLCIGALCQLRAAWATRRLKGD
nr:general alpha-glucoside permease [Quercus suber]